ncbi:TPA: serine/threonine-protein phosphatase [Vibrio parahaemolyticus]|uniref:PP2C family protein-serine/threonine phosphatase n=1 Tax=Vibrio vulnificus TaxID=672 RepID=UPI000735C843|nr:protein phosphatase 2C domain-containing protein [Vibrio vulnificus]HCE3020734.1 serine/threonine-protein phosphatase [Vibrio parahaemolyticus]ELP1875725.1 serine/threonine-protein phosphatase [Vibrio vulnificus]PNM65858.1 serine/threonine-protein phosphatase [Vibrio vulnificus]SUQ27984.1 putative Serine/threonine protein phosphatase [Vibrio vulnificus]HCE4479778.1 serine/threonine-protein phosphatase [Vibrio parahaemolyticus]
MITLNLNESSIFSLAKPEKVLNEDCVLAPVKISNGFLFAVADGVGSYAGADLASLSAIEVLGKLKSKDEILDYKGVFSKILDEVTTLSSYNPDYERASTTLTYCYIDDSNLYVAHIGDCRAYVKQGRKLKQLTKDHTQHQYYLDNNIFKKSQLKNVKGKGVITTAISRVVEMKPDFYTYDLSELLNSEDETISIYLMSDGAHSFWEKSPRFSQNTMDSVVSIAASLKRRIERKGATDDYSFVACKFKKHFK